MKSAHRKCVPRKLKVPKKATYKNCGTFEEELQLRHFFHIVSPFGSKPKVPCLGMSQSSGKRRPVKRIFDLQRAQLCLGERHPQATAFGHA